jgi:hypothetical protein
MTNCAELADYEWLTGPEASAVFHDLAGGAEPLHRRATRLRRSFSAARAHLLLEQVELRERARAKFDRADEMFFTRRGLEQATDEWVAAYKARRFAGRASVGDLCCGIGGDLLALGAVAATVGVDRDPIVTYLAAANAGAVGQEVATETREIGPPDACVFASWHMDPDRRTDGRRTTALAHSSPHMKTIEQLLIASPNAAIKLAPAVDVPDAWRDGCELEWIGRDRQCRQLVAWHGALAEAPAQRRATVLAADGAVLRSIVGEADGRVPLANSLDRFLFEPDPAVLAARLTATLAAEHGLTALAADVDYYTGPIPIDDPLLACFEVEKVLPLDLARLTRHFRDCHCGALEIKMRGVEHEPEEVRRRLKLRGENSATLILTRLSRKRLAIVARRISNGCPAPSVPCSRPPAHATCV